MSNLKEIHNYIDSKKLFLKGMLQLFRNQFNKRKYHSMNEYLFYMRLFGGMMLLYSLMRIVFYLFNTSLFSPFTFSGLMVALWGGLVFDLSALIYLNLPLLVFGLLPLPFKYSSIYQTVLKYIFLIVNGIGVLVNGADIIYYRFILKRTTTSVFSIIENESNLFKLFFRFVYDYWFVAIIIIGVWLLMVRLYGHIIPKPIAFRKKWHYYVTSLLIFVGVAVLAVGGVRGGFAHSTRPITLSNAADYVEAPDQVAVVLNTPFSIIRTVGVKSFQRYSFFKDEKELEAVYTPITTFADTTDMVKKNVVVIILESYSREFFGSLNKGLDNGKYKGYTPFLDSLIAHSLVFPNAYANGRKSIDGMPSILASVPSLVYPYVISEYSGNKINSLGSILGAEGYETSFFHGAPNGSMGFSAFAKIAGIEKYYGKTEYGNDADFDGMWGIWDEEFFQFLAREQSKMKEPFFSSIFSVSSHHPFKVPERYEGKFPDGKIPVCKVIAYTDYALKQYFETVSKTAWFKNSLFVITADHSTLPQFEEYMTSANAFAIPLIFYTPDGTLTPQMNPKTAQQIDIMPTVLDMLHYNGTFSAFGKSLIDTVQSGFAIAYINENYQLIKNDTLFEFDGKKRVGAYDLKNDPFQKSKLPLDAPLNDDEQLVKAIIQQYNNRMLDNKLVP